MQIFKQLKIKAKVITIISIVFLLMGLATLWSVYNLKKINMELDNIANIVIPLESTTAIIDMEILKQQNIVYQFELAIEKQQLHKLTKTSKHIQDHDQTVIKNLELKFEEISKQIEKDLNQEIEFIHSHLNDKHLTPEVKDEIVFLLQEVQSIKHEHEHFHDHAVEFFKHVKENPAVLESTEEQKLIQEEENLLHHIHNVDLHIKEFTKQAALRANQHEKEGILFTIIAVFITGVVGLILAISIAKGILKPLFVLLENVKKVQQGDLSSNISLKTKDEIGTLGAAFSSMVKELRQKEKIKTVFGQYIDPRIVSGLIDDSKTSIDKPQKQEVSVFFSDIKKFTKISEHLPIDELVKLINHYFALMSKPIKQEHGIIDKYIGDAIMAFWTTPFVDKDQHALRACYAAYESLAILEKFNKDLQKTLNIAYDQGVGCRIGLATGPAIIGSIGPETSRSFTVMGTTVNVGARLEAINKMYGTTILVDENTKTKSESDFFFRELDTVRWVANGTPMPVFECVGLKENISANQHEFYQSFQTGLTAYQQADWGKALAAFDTCKKILPNDEAVTLFVNRINHYKLNPPATDWAGVYEFKK